MGTLLIEMLIFKVPIHVHRKVVFNVLISKRKEHQATKASFERLTYVQFMACVHGLPLYKH